MGSHSVTCHLTQVNAPNLDLPTRRDRRLSWPWWLVIYGDGLPACRQSPIQVVTTRQRPDQELNPRPFDHESNVLTVTPPSRLPLIPPPPPPLPQPLLQPLLLLLLMVHLQFSPQYDEYDMYVWFKNIISITRMNRTTVFTNQLHHTNTQIHMSIRRLHRDKHLPSSPIITAKLTSTPNCPTRI